MTVENFNAKRSVVSAVKAKNYEVAELIPAIKNSLELIGGLNAIIKPGNKVFVKFNHLSPPSPAERGIVTHPIFVEAVLTLLKEMKRRAEAHFGSAITNIVLGRPVVFVSDKRSEEAQKQLEHAARRFR